MRAATTNLMVSMASFHGLVQGGLEGNIDSKLGGLFGATSVLSGLLGLIVKRLIRRHGKKCWGVITIAFLNLGALLWTCIAGYPLFVKQVRTPPPAYPSTISPPPAPSSPPCFNRSHPWINRSLHLRIFSVAWLIRFTARGVIEFTARVHA